MDFYSQASNTTRSSGGSVQIEFRRIRELLEQLPDNLIKKAIKTAARKNWEIVLKAAKEKVPVDTGRLQETISLKYGYDKKNKVIFATVGLRKIRAKERRRIRARKAAGKVGKGSGIEYDAYYGVFVEFGAPGQPGPQKAEPYMRPAFDEKYRQALDGFTRDCEMGLESELRKMAQAPKETAS